jgi:anaerobic magnesium-protoporphyrin IX monomethyl ester cyclase
VTPAYRRATARALAVVHEVNRKRLGETARQFDGLM